MTKSLAPFARKKWNRHFFILLLFLLPQYFFAQGTMVFFGSFNRDVSDEGIYVYELDTTNGTLTKISSVGNIVNPSYITLSPDGAYLYACTESKTPGGGSVTSFRYDNAKKMLTWINSRSSAGENPVYATTDKSGRWLIDANYTEGSVSVYPISADGMLEQIVQNIQFEGSSINASRQERSHLHAAVFSPDGEFIFLPDLGSDKIRCYAFNAAKKEPLQISNYAFTRTFPGSGPRHFTFHPNRKFAYCIEELSGMVSSYKYENGLLDSIQRIAAHPNNIVSGFESSDVHISPDGKFLYASNRGAENNIAIFSIANDGTLSTAGYQSTFGNHARVFAMDESGKFLIVTHVTSGNVIVFRRNFATGQLTKVGKEVFIPNVSCVQVKRY